jgi:hypothetical protein
MSYKDPGAKADLNPRPADCSDTHVVDFTSAFLGPALQFCMLFRACRPLLARTERFSRGSVESLSAVFAPARIKVDTRFPRFADLPTLLETDGRTTLACR